MIPARTRILKNAPQKTGPVLYWMSRDQRVYDNWAFLAAYKNALEKNERLLVIFTCSLFYTGANARSYHFLIKGLQEVESELKKLNIPFFCEIGNPPGLICNFIEKHSISAIFSDFDPLKHKQNWKKEIIEKVSIPFFETDAHNIVPCWIVSNKQEYSAKTFRQKITPLLHKYLDDFYLPEAFSPIYAFNEVDWVNILKKLNPDKTVLPVNTIIPGQKQALKKLENFIQNNLTSYGEKRNDPNQEVLSGLSPYLHFGQISAQSIAIEIIRSGCKQEYKNEFLEELIVRRELSDNFCYYNLNYDNYYGIPNWASKTLEKHKKDEREKVYTLEQFENFKTSDELWNAAQKEMVTTGKMHGYMRMYWAKKILEWTSNPEEALKIAIYLNDKYSLDGRDPNGYVGCLWAIAGLHDRPWKERPVYGMIRYMNRNGCERKFDVKKYIKRFS